MLDYLIVGCGLSGMALAEKLRQRGRSFKVVDQGGSGASQVAAGLYNPVVLKRLNPIWEAHRQMATSPGFYQELEKRLGIHAVHRVPILRLLHNPAEQNAWFEGAASTKLQAFLDPQLETVQNGSIKAPMGFGKVLGTGWVDTSLLLNAFAEWLLGQGHLLRERFEHDALQPEDNSGGASWSYRELKVRNIIFCEGFGLKANPYFNYLPLQGTKGEYLTIHAPELQEQHIIKSSVFLIPLGNHRYRVGATYSWNDFEATPTAAARKELQEKLERFLTCGYTIEGQTAGIRPTVPDRRPLVGKHPEKPGLYVMNGMGSRGVLIAPFAADELLQHIENGATLPPEMDILRFPGYF
ncbi:Glycine/D-amino acid oxidase [Robiginitalea myxolifaciens]|uniref:Glycine/D-amino acid oxidase n=1 Tax=Robiginitalea myxolifaciens TaxID=400055 RepID=A0A1I6GBU7_9FLAO|nr:FAD-dependent oxidoreductase [Robiginitalea myxolifaciens]SFR39547.1 Glycine/D-amino acid oxidase [Robiginitalea myxolifaciens]